MGKLVRRLRAAPPRDWPAYAAAATVAAVVEIGLRTTTLPQLTRRLGVRLATDDHPAIAMPASPERLALPTRALRQLRVSVKVVRHWPFGDTCLRRALVAGRRLRHLDPVLQVGVAKVDGTVQAHAWLEIDGVSLDPGSSDFNTVTAVHTQQTGPRAKNPDGSLDTNENDR